MAIQFEEESHKYSSIDGDNILWNSVTSVVGLYKEPFDKQGVAEKCSKSKKGKWSGIDKDTIIKLWEKEADRACTLGTFYHKQREDELLSCETIQRYGETLPVIAPVIDQNGIKIASAQRLTPGIYPEHMVYLKSIGICGQSDLVEVSGNQVHITDYKTNKEIKSESFTNWEGKSKRMLAPLTHLDDCNLNHYNIQLSLYMYIILKHNPNLQAGSLVIHHITFEEEDDKDEYGFPIILKNENGDPIVKTVTIYHLPYMKTEVMEMLKHYERNKEKLLKQKSA
jgi:hypothetical protein